MKASYVTRRAVEKSIPAACRVILIVDDEAAVRRSLRTNLERLGLSVLEASNGMDAWALFRETRGTTSLVITDVRMPKMNGLELAAKVVRLQPDLPVILLTGSPEDPRLRWRLPVIEKPLSWSTALKVICVPCVSQQLN